MNEKPEQLKQEQELLRAIRKGESRAWGQLYDIYAPLLYRRVLMPRLANTTAAEDALSETFKTAIEKLDQYKEHPGGIYPWLSKIAHNKAMDMHRARSLTSRKLVDLSQLLTPLMDEIKGADELLELKVEEGTLESRMSRCLGSLNPRYRRALELRFLQERSREECAELLDLRVGTFDVLLLRAVRSLRKVWTESEVAHG